MLRGRVLLIFFSLNKVYYLGEKILDVFYDPLFQKAADL